MIVNLFLTILRRTLTRRWLFSAMIKNVSLAMTYVEIRTYLNDLWKVKTYTRKTQRNRE